MIRISTFDPALAAMEADRVKFHFHGSYMWAAWTLIGYALLASRRYFKGNYHASHAVHMICGFWLMLISLYFGIRAWRDIGWNIE